MSGAWIALGAAVMTEVVGAGLMKQSDGFRDLASTVAAYAAVACCASATIIALSRLELGVGWALFTALELSATIALGVVVYGEALSPAKLTGLLLCLSGVVILILAEESDERWPRGLGWNAPMWGTGGAVAVALHDDDHYKPFSGT